MNRYKITIMLTKLNIEIWRELVLGDTMLLVSNFGNIQTTDKVYVDKNGRKRIKKGKVKDTYTNTCTKYEYVNITINGISKKLTIHRLMAMAFIPNYANLPMVNHIDEDRQNNNLDNLEWCTNKQNSNYGTRNKRISENHIGLQTGSNNGRSRKIICVELDMVFVCMRECVEYFRDNLNKRISHSGISENCSGKRPDYKGYHFKYVE